MLQYGTAEPPLLYFPGNCCVGSWRRRDGSLYSTASLAYLNDMSTVLYASGTPCPPLRFLRTALLFAYIQRIATRHWISYCLWLTRCSSPARITPSPGPSRTFVSTYSGELRRRDLEQPRCQAR